MADHPQTHSRTDAQKTRTPQARKSFAPFEKPKLPFGCCLMGAVISRLSYRTRRPKPSDPAPPLAHASFNLPTSRYHNPGTSSALQTQQDRIKPSFFVSSPGYISSGAAVAAGAIGTHPRPPHHPQHHPQHHRHLPRDTAGGPPAEHRTPPRTPGSGKLAEGSRGVPDTPPVPVPPQLRNPLPRGTPGRRRGRRRRACIHRRRRCRRRVRRCELWWGEWNGGEAGTVGRKKLRDATRKGGTRCCVTF